MLGPPSTGLKCNSQDLICRTVSGLGAIKGRVVPLQQAIFGLKTSGLVRSGGQAPKPRSGAPQAQGLTA